MPFGSSRPPTDITPRGWSSPESAPGFPLSFFFHSSRAFVSSGTPYQTLALVIGRTWLIGYSYRKFLRLLLRMWLWCVWGVIWCFPFRPYSLAGTGTYEISVLRLRGFLACLRWFFMSCSCFSFLVVYSASGMLSVAALLAGEHDSDTTTACPRNYYYYFVVFFRFFAFRPSVSKP